MIHQGKAENKWNFFENWWKCAVVFSGSGWSSKVSPAATEKFWSFPISWSQLSDMRFLWQRKSWRAEHWITSTLYSCALTQAESMPSAINVSGGCVCPAWSSASCGPQQLTSPCQRLPKRCSVQPWIHSLFNCLCFPKLSLWCGSHFRGCKQIHIVLHSALAQGYFLHMQRLFLWPSGSFMLAGQPKETLMELNHASFLLLAFLRGRFIYLFVPRLPKAGH